MSKFVLQMIKIGHDMLFPILRLHVLLQQLPSKRELKVKVKLTLEQAMKAQRRKRGTAVLIL